MDYIGTNSQGTANAPNGMSDQLLGTWFQPGFPFLGAGHCAILPWPHVRNQEKRFPREHFTFAREQKRFAGERFAFAREEKRFAREQKRFAGERFAFAREEKRFAREHFAFAREQKRFPRCRRTGVVSPLRRTPTWPSARVRRQQVSLQKTSEGNLYADRCRPRKLRKTPTKGN